MNKNLNDIQNLQYFGGKRKKHTQKIWESKKSISFTTIYYDFAYIPADTRRRLRL